MYNIEPFNKNDDSKAFDCGNYNLNKYLISYASQDIKRHLASVFVCKNNDQEICGYYSLAANSVDVSKLNNEFTRKLPYYPYLPAILIGRLAVNKKQQQQGVGEYILMDALYRAFKVDVAAYVVIVEAKDDKAVNFYKKYDFIQFEDNSNKLFLPMKVIAKLFS